MRTPIEIKISAEVPLGNEYAEYHVPANGKKFTIVKFFGEAAFSKNSVVKLLWDYNAAGEQILWSIKGSSSMPLNIELTGDGVKKLAIALDNGELGSVFMSGYVLILQED